MSTIITREGKGSPLEWAEVDANFTNLNTDKYQEGSAIGAVTPAAGTFTTLTATGQTSLGGAAGSEGLRVTTTASGINWVQIKGAVSGDDPSIISAGSQSRNIRYRTGVGAAHIFETGSYANSQLIIANTASAVNYVQVTGAATGGTPQISVQGSDSNAGMQISTKGTGTFEVKTNNFTQTQLLVTHTANAVNRLSITGGIAGAAPVLSTNGSDTNIDLTLTPKGTGKVRFGTYTGTILTPTGYVEIKDAGGTIRRLLVG